MEKFYQYLILRRIRKILQDKQLATYKLDKEDLIKRLNKYFWDESNRLDEFWNRKIYKKYIHYIDEVKEKHKDRTDINYKTVGFEILDNRTDELISCLIDQKILIPDDKTPVNYYIYQISILNFLYTFFNVIILGFGVSLLASLVANFLWEIK